MQERNPGSVAAFGEACKRYGQAPADDLLQESHVFVDFLTSAYGKVGTAQCEAYIGHCG